MNSKLFLTVKKNFTQEQTAQEVISYFWTRRLKHPGELNQFSVTTFMTSKL